MSGLDKISSRFTCERSKQWEEAERRIREAKNPVEKGPQTDHRSLYEKLQANRILKEEEYQESWKLSNLIRTLDDDEIDFLDKLRKEKIKIEEEAKKSIQENLKIFRREREQFDQSIQQSLHSLGETIDVLKPTELRERPLKKMKDNALKGVIFKKNKDTFSKRALPKPVDQSFSKDMNNTVNEISSSTEITLPVSQTSSEVPSVSTPPSTIIDNKLIIYQSDSDEKG